MVRVGRKQGGTPPTRESALFQAFLRRQKLKLTTERQDILRTLFEKQSHTDAESLLADLKDLGSDVSRATVYRTLDLLVQAGLIRRNSLGAGHAIYEPVREGEHHDHLVCLVCGKVLEFFRPDLEQLQEAICREQAFKPMHHSLQIFGLCSSCDGQVDESTLPERIAQLHA